MLDARYLSIRPGLGAKETQDIQIGNPVISPVVSRIIMPGCTSSGQGWNGNVFEMHRKIYKKTRINFDSA